MTNTIVNGDSAHGLAKLTSSLLVSLLFCSAVPIESAYTQVTPASKQKYFLSFSQFTAESRSLLSTEVESIFEYPCAGFALQLSQSIVKDTVILKIGSVVRPDPCLQTNTKAVGKIVLGPFDTGQYILRLEHSDQNDIYSLTIEPTRFYVRPVNASFTNILTTFSDQQPDTTAIIERKPIRMFLDCSPDCHQDYVKTELTSFDYVRDKELANIHLLITSEAAGNGGQRVTLTFIGLNEFSGLSDTMSFGTQPTDTEDIIRQKLVKSIKAGVVRYAARTFLAEHMEIYFPESGSQTPQETDPWDNWVFNADVSGELNGQKSTRQTKLAGSFSANRITEAWKIKLGTSFTYAQDVYSFDDQTYKSIARSELLSGLGVYSLDEHWSAGGFFSVSSSTFGNSRLSLTVAPALEYNFFRYAESTRRECRLLYRIGLNRFNYFSETIFFKTNETVVDHTLSFVFGLNEPWGRAGAKLEGSQYLHDLSKNRLEFSADLSVRVVEGFSFRAYGVVSLIHNQLSLPALGATPEEILLQRRELATTYSYYTGLGVSYTFGSIFTNVVNPRFGD